MPKQFKIDNEPKSYKEGTYPKMPDEGDEVVYEPTKGEKVNVELWVRYPSYDFIFGVPDKSSCRHKKEISFFQFRDTRNEQARVCFYLDITETEEMIKGFTAVLKKSKENSKHLWKEEQKK